MPKKNEPIIAHLGLLALDVQASFLKGFSEPDSFVRRIKFCVEATEQFGIPTLFTEQRPDVLGHTLEDIKELNPEAQRVAKTGFSAFTESAVVDWIEKEDVHHLLVIGLETPICVYQTVLDAMAQDLDVTILSDGVSCRRKEDGSCVLTSLRINGAHVLPSETVFYSLLRDSKHPAFKEFTQLVKKYSDK